MLKLLDVFLPVLIAVHFYFLKQPIDHYDKGQIRFLCIF